MFADELERAEHNNFQVRLVDFAATRVRQTPGKMYSSAILVPALTRSTGASRPMVEFSAIFGLALCVHVVQ